MSSSLEAVKTCLNGWWDFAPAFPGAVTDEIPEKGWYTRQFLVPSYWSKPMYGVRKKGEVYYTDQRKSQPEEDDEFLFDAYDYPVEWSKTRSGWVRREVRLDSMGHGKRYVLFFEGVAPYASLYINGNFVCKSIDPFLPMEADVTAYLHVGSNEVAVYIEDYDRDENGKTMVPSGNMFMCRISGIWQDVYLIERSEIYVSDMTIRTSTRTRGLTVSVEVTNVSDQVRQTRLIPSVTEWRKGGHSPCPTVLTLPETVITIPPEEKRQYDFTVAWPDAEWWYPENPKLYLLHTKVVVDDGVVSEACERFGFREIWIDGASLMLNDYPLHLFSDWGHKVTPYHHTEAWIRQWFGMIKDANMNHSRLHTHPHPRIYLDLADEEGILITGETAIHGSGADGAADCPAYWEAAREHIRRYVRRDKNHPSLILWSVENEMRWGARTTLPREQLPQLRKLINELDPTRPAYHEGDSSMWNEADQDMLSRHYGKEASGIEWWDRSKPLNSGEMALYHHAGPNNTQHLAGDAVWASFAEVNKASAEDAAMIIEAGRTLGVCCFGPWNLSCLENLRMEKQPIRLQYDDFESPGVKPLHVPPHSSEFAFWEKEGKGYTPHYSFPIQKHAFRPLAVIDLSMKHAYFCGGDWSREIYIVNDTAQRLDGRLKVSLSCDGHAAAEWETAICLPRGERVSHVINAVIPLLPSDQAYADYEYTAWFEANGQVLDQWTKPLRFYTRQHQRGACELAGTLGIFGNGTIGTLLHQVGIPCTGIHSLDEEHLAGIKILIMDKHTVKPGTRQNQQLLHFVRKGGRVILLEQKHSVFPGLVLEEKTVLTAFIRAYGHPVVQGMTDGDFAFWGEDPYPALANDGYVAHRMYRKDDAKHALFILDSDEGGFGAGELEYSPLIESQAGAGLLLACQMRISDKWMDTPAAERLFLQLIRRADTYIPPTPSDDLIAADGDALEAIPDLVKKAMEGKKVFVHDVAEAALPVWSQALGFEIRAKDVGEVYQVIRSGEDPVISGISNADLSGVETFTYTGNHARNYKVGRVFLEPSAHMESLLETPTESCLKELMVYNGRTEPLRAHTISRFLYVEQPERAVALARIKVGQGEILLNQFAPPAGARARFDRVMNRMKANLGFVDSTPDSLLDGDQVPREKANSPGFPSSIYQNTQVCDNERWTQMVQSTFPSAEGVASHPMLNLPGWMKVDNDSGIWEVSPNGSEHPVFLYYSLHSPSVRKYTNTNLGVPNPEALSYLDVYVKGRVSLVVNGRSYEPITTAEDLTTFTEISLEKGHNYVLLKLESEKTEVVRMQWRNIMRQPETGFTFG